MQSTQKECAQGGVAPAAAELLAVCGHSTAYTMLLAGRDSRQMPQVTAASERLLLLPGLRPFLGGGGVTALAFSAAEPAARRACNLVTLLGISGAGVGTENAASGALCAASLADRRSFFAAGPSSTTPVGDPTAVSVWVCVPGTAADGSELWVRARLMLVL